MTKQRFPWKHLVLAMCLVIGVARAEERINSISGTASTRPSTTAPLVMSKDGVRTEIRAIATGEPGADGWVAARSAAGRFSVMLPDRYNDFSVSSETVKNTPLIMHAVGINKPGTGKFAAFRMIGGDVPSNEARVKELAQKLADDNRPFSKVLKIENTSGATYECAIVGLHSAARIRYVAQDGNLFMLSVEYLPTAPAAVDAAVDRFFGSLKVEPAQAKER